jgi:epsin
LLIQATSEENWQTPTPILHEICNVAYNYEEWQKIQTFVWEKLKLKKWRKVLKVKFFLI